MESALLLIRLLFAGVFGVAGLAKLFDREGSRRSGRDFGVPERLAGVFSVLLPIAEIAISLSMLFVELSWFGAIGSVLLLAAFTAGMIIQMVKGQAPDCHCFGQLHSEPVGARSLVRNAVLIVPAVILAAAGRSFQGTDLTKMDSGLFQLISAIIFVALLLSVILHLTQIAGRQREILKRLEIIEVLGRDGGSVDRQDAGSPHDGLPIGAFVPAFELLGSNGEIVNSNSIGKGRPALLFFVSPSCTPCKAVLPKIREWADELADKLEIVFISSGTIEENDEVFGSTERRTMLRQKAREFADSMNAKWTPSAVFIDQNGKVASHVAAGDTAIATLVDKVRAADVTRPFVHFALGNGANPHSHIEVGTDVPEFEVIAIDGKTVTSSDLKGRSTLLAFWSPTCPHCVKIADELKEWESEKLPDEPEMIMFSDGEVEMHRELGLDSTIILDKDYTVAGKIGMHGTPSAILIDENGKYASEIAIGAPNIWALLGRQTENKA